MPRPRRQTSSAAQTGEQSSAGPSRGEGSLDAKAWIDAALDLLVKDSVENIHIEALAKQLGVTKGSFYYHFKDRPALLAAILNTWRQRATLTIIDRLEQANVPPEDRVRHLMDLPFVGRNERRGALVELAVRGWARRDRMAADAVKEVDQQRLRYVTILFKSMGLGEEEAANRAFLVYSYILAESLLHDAIADQPANSRRQRCEAILLNRRP